MKTKCRVENRTCSSRDRNGLAWMKPLTKSAASRQRFHIHIRIRELLLCELWLPAALGGMTIAAKAQPASVGRAASTNPAPALPPGQMRQLTQQGLQPLLQEGSRLTPSQAEAIEADLKRNPGDESLWARLLGFSATQSSETNALPFARFYARIVEANPTSVLVYPSGINLFSQLLMDEACFEVVASKWIEVASRPETNVEILSRAGSFLTASPVFDQYARQGEALLEKAMVLEPGNPQRPLVLAEHYLKKAQPRFDNPDGNIAAARKALACFQAALKQLPESDRARPELRQKLTRTAFWAVEYRQAKTYAREWLETAQQMESSPAPATQNQRHTRAADRGHAIHDANMILGEIALSEGRTKEATGFLIEAGKVTNGWTLTSYGPDLTLVNDLLNLGESQAVLTFFDECDVFWTTGRDRLAQWRKAVQAGQKPDFGSGFHFRFQRVK
jgi:hypothetical protein